MKINEKKLLARLSKLPVNSGHARNIRRKLGLGEFAPRVEEKVQEVVPEVVTPTTKKRKKSK